MPGNLLPAKAELPFDVDRSVFIQAQKTDQSLAACLTAAVLPAAEIPCVYNIADGILMHNWHPPAAGVDFQQNGVEFRQVLVVSAWELKTKQNT